MVTKLPAGHRRERNTAFLVGSFQKFSFFRLFVRESGGRPGKFRGLPLRVFPQGCAPRAAQIFDNLVGRTRKHSSVL
jgi:hypothetical protein